MARTLIVGQSGTGKSWYKGFLLEQSIPLFENALIYDVENEERGFSDGNGEPLLKAYYVDRTFLNERNIAKDLVQNKRVRVVPDSLTPDEQRELAEYISIAAMHLKDCLVSIDEAHVIAKNHQMGQRLERVVTGGRKSGVEQIYATQRLQKVSETMVSQCDRLVVFAVAGNNDIAKIDEHGVPDEAVSEIMDLDSKEAVVINTANMEYERLDTTELKRDYTHYAGDDGKTDGLLPV